MEEIKVGEYVRTKSGYIAKVLDVQERSSIISRCSGRKVTYQPRYWIDNKNGSISKKFILKHSFNIIDLIEVGDYVNGKLIFHTDIGENSAYIYYENCRTFTDYQIRDVITKEQFESIKYVVGD